MRFLFFTDLHLRQSAPRWRVGDYGEDLLQKLGAVVDIAVREECEYLVFGGDFIDAWNVSLQLVNRAIDLLVDQPFKMLFVIGQHDMVAHTPALAWGSAISLLKRALPEGSMVLSGESFAHGLYFSGLNYYEGIEEEIRRGKLKEWGCEVIAVHTMIVPSPVPWPHILIEEIETEAKIVLSGDYHPGFSPTLHEGTWFINPGAVARVAITDAERIPQVALVDTEKLPDNPAVYLDLPHKPAEEVFDLEEYEELQSREEARGEYAEMLQRMVAGGHSSWEAMFQTAREEGIIEEEVLDEAYSRCKGIAEGTQ